MLVNHVVDYVIILCCLSQRVQRTYAPDGVVCQMSAARYYGLTTYWPDAVDVAIERRKKLSTVPDFPKFNVVYYSKKDMNWESKPLRRERILSEFMTWKKRLQIFFFIGIKLESMKRKRF